MVDCNKISENIIIVFFEKGTESVSKIEDFVARGETLLTIDFDNRKDNLENEWKNGKRKIEYLIVENNFKNITTKFSGSNGILKQMYQINFPLLFV